VNEAVALGYVALRIMESAIIVVGLMSLMSVVTLREDFAGTGADSDSLNIAGQALVALHDWTFLLGPQFCAGFGNGILLGYLMYKSGLVPSRMAMLGLIGGPLAFIGGVFVLFGRSISRVRCCSPLRPSRSRGSSRSPSISPSRGLGGTLRSSLR